LSETATRRRWRKDTAESLFGRNCARLALRDLIAARGGVPADTLRGHAKGDRILLVEGNSDDVQLTVRAKRKYGVSNKVVVARDSAEVLDRLLGADPLPNPVLPNLRLPRLDGPEVLKHLREHDRTRCLPVIHLTSCEGKREKSAQVHDACADLWLSKSVDFERFSREAWRAKSLVIGSNLTSAQERCTPARPCETP